MVRGGRIGKLVLRRCLDDPDIEVVLLNDLMSAQQIRSSLIRDSVHGWYDGEVNVSVDSDGRAYIVVQRKLHPGGVLLGTEQSYSIAVFSERDPAKLQLNGVDVMIEATGVFTRRQQLEVYRGAGAERVILTAPASTDEDVDLTVVLGVNDHQYDSRKHFLLSNASCTTNCLAPVLQVLDEHFGVLKADMLTVHARTNDQRVVDGTHKDPFLPLFFQNTHVVYVYVLTMNFVKISKTSLKLKTYCQISTKPCGIGSKSI